VSLVEDLVIGNDTSREDHWFAYLNALTVDRPGNIWTVDPKSIRIRVFGPDGTLVRAFGRAGQGPGEFSGPGGILAAPDGTIVVTDLLNRRLSYFGRQGEHLRDASFGAFNLAGLVVDGRSNLYIINSVREEKHTWELLMLTPDMQLVRKIHTLSFDVKPRTVNLISYRLFYDLAGEDRIAWMDSTDYPIQVVDASGKKVMKIFKNRDPRKFTASDRDSFIKNRFPKGAPAGIELEFPDFYPAASAFLTDEKGRIYVRTYEADDRGRAAVDVFDAAGLYIARFFVPQKEETVTVRGGKLYSYVLESEAGNPLVKRYALTWK
jgi:sugar lactone lactonase YvrE